MIVSIGSKNLLLGVTPKNINFIHEIDRSDLEAGTESKEQHEFFDKLQYFFNRSGDK